MEKNENDKMNEGEWKWIKRNKKEWDAINPTIRHFTGHMGGSRGGFGRKWNKNRLYRKNEGAKWKWVCNNWL